MTPNAALVVERDRLLQVLSRLAGVKIVVVGDLVLDRYVVGKATRLSREAPVPVLEYEREFDLPGAAANPAKNVQALGGTVWVVGVVGADAEGEHLVSHLVEAGVDVSGVIVDPSRPTVTKSRVLAEDGTRIHQQIVRIDRLDRRPLGSKIAADLSGRVREIGAMADAIVLSDYKIGVIRGEVIDAGRALAAKGRLVTVDSQRDLLIFEGLTVVKVNQQEAENALRCTLTDEAACAAACASLLRELGTSGVVITRGIEGMSVGDRGAYAHIPASNRSEVFDVTGAGDTVIAVLTLGLAAGGSLLEAAYLSNLAAGQVVRKLGNATTSVGEVRSIVESMSAQAVVSTLANVL